MTIAPIVALLLGGTAPPVAVRIDAPTVADPLFQELLDRDAQFRSAQFANPDWRRSSRSPRAVGRCAA